MLSLSERVSRQRSLRNWGTFLLALTVVFSAIPFAGLSPSAVAQEEQPAAADPAPPADGGGGGAESEDDASLQSRNFLTWMIDALGWFWMLVFAALSFVMVALIMMNLLQVRRDVLLPNDFVEEFEQKLNGKDFQGAYEIARNDDSFVARVLASGMGRLSRGYPEAVEGMQEAGEDENMALEHRLSFLALIGTVAPMLGLMGTVQGMIASFDKIASSAVSPKPSELAEGISTALFTTLIGLGIAIPAMVFYSILKNRIQRLVLEIGMVSEGLMSRFAAVGKGGASGSGTKPA
ncbi:MAG: MotA/TolQ/ExbB proton channel family protein [Fuerstiella sp.]|nr:MotA/TolQ/ExbB proton channel family protein [Fuerstiella sp.]MCP4859349.1 MotA/TolQ/ExbB proton channel family protein [Fuerstiella sp.]